MSPIWERQWIGIGIHVFARCSIHCNAFEGMLIKLSEGMCIGMVVYLRLALAHVTYDTPKIRFHFFFFFFFSFFLDHTLFLLQKSKYLFGYDLEQSDEKAGFQSKLYNVAMITCWWLVSGLIVGPLIFWTVLSHLALFLVHES